MSHQWWEQDRIYLGLSYRRTVGRDMYSGRDAGEEMEAVERRGDVD